jgi:hypothetical protein
MDLAHDRNHALYGAQLNNQHERNRDNFVAKMKNNTSHKYFKKYKIFRLTTNVLDEVLVLRKELWRLELDVEEVRKGETKARKAEGGLGE